MLFCGVAHIAVPGVGGVTGVRLENKIVPIGLGKNGRGGYRLKLGVAFDDTFVRNVGVVLESVAVNQKKLWSDA